MIRAVLPLALAALAVPAHAQQSKPPAFASGAGIVRFIDAPKTSLSREIAIAVNPELRDAPFDVASYDLDGDGKPEVLAKSRAEKDCDPDKTRCRVVVMRETPQGWAKILDRRAAEVSVGSIGFGGFRAVALDSREGFAFNGSIYRLDLAQTGKPVSFTEAPNATRPMLVAQFGDGARRLKGLTVKVASLSPKDGETVVMARLEGPGACGSTFGCPWRLLQRKNDSYTVLSSGMGGPDASILGVVRGGWRDLAVKLPTGYAVYGWTGDRYVLSERVNEETRR